MPHILHMFHTKYSQLVTCKVSIIMINIQMLFIAQKLLNMSVSLVVANSSYLVMDNLNFTICLTE